MNGGASLALLTFVGHLSGTNPEKIPAIAASLTVFVGGVLVAALASGTTYLCQWFYAHGGGWQRPASPGQRRDPTSPGQLLVLDCLYDDVIEGTRDVILARIAEIFANSRAEAPLARGVPPKSNFSPTPTPR